MITKLPTTASTKKTRNFTLSCSTKFLQTTVLSALFFLLLGVGESWGQTNSTFNYTGAIQTFTVPAGVYSLTIKSWGAGGGGSYGSGSVYVYGGSGAFTKGILAVTPGQQLSIVVGQGGIQSTSTSSAGGYGGGGSAGGAYGGSGGGYSGVFSSSTLSQSNAVIISGGGGGAGYYSGFSTSYAYGGGGGATSGSGGGNYSSTYTGGGGATLSSGGSISLYNNSSTNARCGGVGTPLQGGNSGVYANSGGGGGGGYYGGSAGYGSGASSGFYSTGGGGGSSFLSSTLLNTSNLAGTYTTNATTAQAPGNAEAGYTAGIGNGNTNTTRGGNGLVVISYMQITSQPSYTSVCSGASNATFTVAATGATTWQWQEYNGTSWSNITNGGIYSNATTATLTLTNPTTAVNGYKYRCLVNSCSYTDGNATLTVNTLPTNPSGTVSNDAAACGNVTLTYSSPSSSIYWQTSASGTSTANPTTSTYSLASSGTIYARAYNSPTGCWSSGTVNSDAITVTPQAAPTITIAASPSGTICAGTNITFTPTTSTPSNTNSYVWYKNGAQVGTTSTYSTTTLANNDQVYCVVTSNSACVPSGNTSGTSTTTTISVTSLPTTQATIGSYTNNTSGTGLTVNWTRGNGSAGVIVVARATATADVAPVSGTTYTANAALGSGTGTAITGTGNYVVYVGTGTNVAVTGLTSGTSYTYTVYEYSGSCYLTPGTSSAVSTPLIINMSNGSSTTCSATLYDSGGKDAITCGSSTSSGVYQNNETYTYTINPPAGSLIRAAFSKFCTESFDGLVIYNGASTSASTFNSGLAAGSSTTNTPAGSYYGNLSPFTVTSTTGALTFLWRSDSSTLYPGFAATISCITPTITTSGTLSPFSSCSGSVSTAQSFTVSGTDLTAYLVVTAPTGFEVSTSQTGTYASNVSFTPSSGTVSTQTVWVRMAALSSNPTSANISCTSTSASTQNVSVSGEVKTSPSVTFTSLPGATTCLNTDITYTTQTGMSGYTWSIPGTNGTDYSITSGGIGTSSNTVTLKWLTAGSKTVTVNYTNSNGCSAVSATSSTTTATAQPTLTSLAYSGATYCNALTTSGTPTLNGTNAYTGGVYSASPAGLSINTTTGVINPSASTAGQYTVTYSLSAAGGCSSASITSGTVEILPAATVTLASATQVAAAGIATGTSSNQIYSFSLAVNNNGINGSLDSVSFTTTNSAADILNYKLWYSSSSSFASASQIGSSITSSLGSGSHAFTSLTQDILANNTGYFWITADISSSATFGNTLIVSAMTSSNLSLTYTNSCGSVIGSTTTGGTQTFTCSTGLSGTKSVGTTGDYTSFTGTNGLFSAINNCGLSSNLVVNVISDVTETGAVALNQWTESGSGGYTLTIQPDASTVRTISGTAVATGVPMININGADRVTINGTNKYLLFRNTNTTAANTGPTIQFTNGSTSCTVANCDVENNGTTSTYGNIVLGSTGTNSVAISSNNLHGATGGTTGNSYTSIYSNNVNNTLSVTNNNIYNWFVEGIYAAAIADNAVITGNSFYQTATCNYNGQYAIDVNSGNGHNISGNYIGGTQSNCGGTPWVNSVKVSFYGLYLNLGTSIASSIQGNVIQNINLTSTNSSGTAALFYGITVVGGLVNVGTMTGNIIGHESTTNSITIAGTNSSYASVFISGSGAFAGSKFENNILANLTYTGSGLPYFIGLSLNGDAKKNRIFKIGSSNANSSINIQGISISGTGGGELSNNIISLNGVSSLACNLTGIYDNTATGAIYNIYNNSINIYGISNNSGGSTWGIYRGSLSTSTFNLKNNIVVNSRTGGSAVAYHTGVYIYNSGNFTSDYNNIYADGTSTGPVGYYGGSNKQTFANWQASFTGCDTNSKNVNPIFISSTDLHLNTSSNCTLDGAGTPIASVTTDFDGETRNATTPDIGADEFTGTYPTFSELSAAAKCYSASAQTTSLTYSSANTPTNYSITWSSSPTNTFSAVNNSSITSPISISIPAATVAGTYTGTIVCKNSAGCSGAGSNFTVTVNPLPTATISAGSATTFCSGGSVVLTASAGSSYVWKKDGATISGETAQAYTATTSGAYTVVVTSAAGCSATSEATAVSVNARPNQPELSNLTLCGTGSVTLTDSALGSGYSINWYDSLLATTPIYTVGTSYTTPNLTTSTTYFAETKNTSTGCTSVSRTEVVVNVNVTNTFTDTSGDHKWFNTANWSCGTLPNETTNVVIQTGKAVNILYVPNPSDGPILSAKANTITLQEGSATSLTINSGHSLIVTDMITILGASTTQANFVVESGASLKQINDVSNVGVIKVKRATRDIKRYDAVLWSSPVEGQVVNNLASGMNTNYTNYYSVQNNTWNVLQDQTTATFPEGIAYMLRTPLNYSLTPTPWEVTFTGVPNNGLVTVNGVPTTDSTNRQYFLVGNPYSSPIDLNLFLASNPNVTGVFAFYRKTNGANYTGYAYLTKNGSSRTFQPNYGSNSAGAQDNNDVIPVGQGFFVQMQYGVPGVVTFNNGMRIVNNHGTYNRLQTNTVDKYRLAVTASSNSTNYSQMTLNYEEESSVNFDTGYDAESFNDGRTSLSSMIASKPYSIQSRGSYAASDFVPLYFKTNISGEHRISLSDASGVFAADQMVIIKDNLTGVQHNLTANGDYVFTSATGTFTNRFEVIYQQAYYTALQANSCGATIANMSSLVYADIVNGATGYRFKVVNNTTSAVQTIDRPQHWFAFNMLSAYDYNTPYTISVQVQKDGVWTGYYGATCTVNSPNIATTGVMQINPSQCGMTLPTLGTVIATTPVAGATGYKFRITNTTAGATGNNLVQEITRTNHWFSLGMLPRYNYGSSYAIEVAVKTTGGYTAYGNACTVYSPAVPTLATCGQTVATATTLVRTTAMNLATQYRFQVTRMSTQETITFDTANYWFSFRVNVPGYAAGEQYGVRVAVMTAGAWSPYGDACDITAPIATARTTEEAAPSEANLFKPVAYPNPFASEFSIALATPFQDDVTIVVYDLQGRLIEKQTVPVSLIDTIHIGANYQMGDYMLVVSQGPAIESMLLHKE